MKVFVSGATGFIGVQLVKRLAASGTEVHALYRSEEKARMITMKGVRLFKGDILDMKSLEEAMQDCSSAYHVAAFAGTWAPPLKVRELNVDGALNVIRSAEKSGIKRVVVTSTAGILGPSLAGEQVDESTPPPASFFTSYEHSKFILEQSIKDLDIHVEVVIVNPTRVYGPGLLSQSNGVTLMVKKYLNDNWRYLPGNGNQSGNYVFIEDVVTGHMLAMDKGKPGERYILGGENLTYLQLFEIVRHLSHCKKRLYPIPLWLMLLISRVMKIIAQITGTTPLIVPELVRKFNHHWRVSSEKAIKELGYNPISATEGLDITVRWIRNKL